MTRLFKTRNFARWMKKTDLSDELLYAAVGEMELGLIDADLGGGVVKKRIAYQGRGKRGCSRILIATNKNDRWFFVFGFDKNERDNISSTELKALQTLASDLLNFSATELESEIKNNTLQEIYYDTKA